MNPLSIHGVNKLTTEEKREIYSRLIPADIFKRFNLPPKLIGPSVHDLLRLNCPPNSTLAEMELYHRPGFPDPILYGQITDTMQGQVHVLLYVLNDPESVRFNVDCLPDGRTTNFGTQLRNLEAEYAALQYGLAPGQIRRGLGLFAEAVTAFEKFVSGIGQDIFFVEPLYYHNAVAFEKHGFAYQQGRKLMERIEDGLAEDGDLLPLLNSSTPFRSPQAAKSIRLRSWAIHDNLLGEPFTNVTMYKWVGKMANTNTCQNCPW